MKYFLKCSKKVVNRGGGDLTDNPALSLMSGAGSEPVHVRFESDQIRMYNTAINIKSHKIATLSQNRWMISLLIMKRKSIHPSFHRMNAFYILLLTMKSYIAFGTVDGGINIGIFILIRNSGTSLH
jgi:hypothetical protein